MTDLEAEDHSVVDEDVEEMRRHSEGDQDDEAAGRNMPDFFSFGIAGRIRDFFERLFKGRRRP